jgi:hypothetical protein
MGGPSQGTELDCVGEASRRLLVVGRLGGVVYEVDAGRKVVTVADLINVLWQWAHRAPPGERPRPQHHPRSRPLR